MSFRRSLVFTLELLATVVVLLCGSALAAMPSERKIDASVRRTSPEEMLGPTTLLISGYNPVRYEVTFSQGSVEVKGPELSKLTFIPSLEAPAPAPKASTAPSPGKGLSSSQLVGRSVNVQKLAGAIELGATVDDSLKQIAERDRGDTRSEYEQLKQLVADADAEARRLLMASEKLTADIRLALLQVEEVLCRLNGAAQDITMLALSDANQKTVEGALVALRTNTKSPGCSTTGSETHADDQLTSSEDLSRRLKALTGDVDNLPIRFAGFSLWIVDGNNRDDYRALKSHVEDLADKLAPILPGGKTTEAIAKLRDQLQRWVIILSDLPYETRISVPCGVSFLSGRETTIKMTRVDRLESDATKRSSTEEIAKVTCQSHFSISGGITRSSNDEGTVAFVQGADATGKLEKRFGFTDRGSERIEPILLINAELWRAPHGDHRFAVSAGTVINTDGAGKRSTIGYAVGLSWILKEEFVLTIGQQYDRVSKLAGGFDEGDLVPADLAVPPLERGWQNDWMLSVSYRVR